MTKTRFPHPVTIGDGLKWVSKISSYVAVVPLFLIMILAVLDVIGGKVFGRSIQSTVETIQYMNVPLVCLAMSYVEFENGHTRINVLTKHYPQVIQKILFMLGSLLGCVICSYVCYSALGTFGDYFQRQTPIQSSSPILVWPFMLCLLIGYGLTGLSFLWSGIRYIKAPSNQTEESKKSELLPNNLTE